jgi:hypothetical protein
VLTWVAVILSAIALVIPGIGEFILAAGIAMAVVTVAANGILALTGNGSWADFGIAMAGLLTFGVGKLLGPAIQKVLKTVGTTIKNSIGRAMQAARGAGRAGDEDMIPLIERGGPPKEWNLPAGVTRTEHPDLGDNNAFRIGSSWQNSKGVVFTRLREFVGYKGVNRARSAFYRKSVQRERGAQNGNGSRHWKGFYTAENPKSAGSWAIEKNPEGVGVVPGDVLRYLHGREVTIATVPRELGSGEAELHAARDMFGYEKYDKVPLMQRMGHDGYILRNPLGDDGYENVVPWKMTRPSGSASPWGSVTIDKATGGGAWSATASGTDGIRPRLGYEATP